MSDHTPTVNRALTANGTDGLHDQEISLVDTTAPDSGAQKSRSRSQSPRWRELARNATKSSVKDQLARRKYAKWREDRYTVENDEEEAHTQPTQITEGSTVIDFAKSKDSRSREDKKHKSRKKRPYEIDILYENQRGSFFCGIPLYSHSSLLNFDPGPWVTKDFKDSAVNITNAQVPDPSWQWAWKTWYVDMSYDVDEEGWQYSFSFGRSFGWHGTHPWFHSFVRRRRWLRKRVKRDHAISGEKATTMSAAHKLTTDYFTIHSKRDRSPGSAVDSESKRPVSYSSATETELSPDDIKDIATLLKALRMATVDREKIDAVKKFIEQGEEELAYLGEHIPNIMSFLVFQSSRRQLLAYLKETANGAQRHRDDHEAEQKLEGDVEHRRIDSLLAAVGSADKQISGLEYWSDRKHVLKAADGDAATTKAIAKIFDEPAPEPKSEENPVDKIKGISSSAEVDTDPSQHAIHDVDNNQVTEAGTGKGKGKGKEIRYEGGDHVADSESPPRLGHDQILIPDGE